MSLTLTCLGGAAAWPNPGQGCSSFLVSTGGTNLLIDCGTNTLLELRKRTRFSEVTAVVISHCHSDHILDLVPYRYGLVYGRERPQGPIPLWLPPGGREVITALGDVLGGKAESTEGFWDAAFDVREYDPNAALEVGGMRIQFARTEHAAECYAMRVTSTEGSTLAYSADSGRIGPLLEIAANCDILIAEATLPESDERLPSAGHLMPSEAGKLAGVSGAGMLVLTHLWSERPDSDVIEAARTAYDGPIEIARPGLVVHA